MQKQAWCYYRLALFTILTSTSVFSKSIFENRLGIASKDDDFAQYPFKRKINTEQPLFVAAHEEQPDLVYPDANVQDLTRSRRIDQPLNEPSGLYDRQSRGTLEKQLDLKRSTLDKRADRLYKRELHRREDGYGIVYGNGRPIGILEPFPQSYEFAPLLSSGEGIEEIEQPANPRRSVIDVVYPSDAMPSISRDWENGEALQETAKFADDKYPLLLTDFKINNRLNNLKRDNKDTANKDIKMKNRNPYAKRDTEINNQKTPPSDKGVDVKTKESPDVKRSVSGITNEKIAELKAALNRIQNPGPSDKVEEIEGDLKDILSDMGLINGEDKDLDSSKNKREVDIEDENLEEGTNKIELIKTTHDIPIVDRSKREDTKEEKDDNVVDLSQPKQETKIEDVLVAKSNLKDQSNADALDKEDAKRETDKINVANYQSEGEAYLRSKRQEAGDILKGLEKSGDLTVSGNKSPLACSGNDAEVEKKHSKESETTSLPTDKAKRQDDLEYQQQLEQSIQAKIDAIKEQVKREIAALKAKEVAANERRKRDVAETLIDAETSAVNPQEHPGEKLTPHVRQRRNLENLPPHKRIKRGLPDFSNLNNIDSGDYLDLANDKSRDQRETINDYQVDPQENKYMPENAPIKDDAVNIIKKEDSSSIEKKSADVEKTKNEVAQSQEKIDEPTVGDASNNPEKKQSKEKTNENKRDAEDASMGDETAGLDSVDLNPDLQKSKEEVNLQEASRRKRRDVDDELAQRRKRADAIVPYAKSAFFPYRAEEDDGGDEGDEFEDADSYDEHLRKRETYPYNPKQFRRAIDYQDYAAAEEQPEQKRSLSNKYVASMNSDVYENPRNYLYSPGTFVRKKRQDFDQLVALHGGGPMLHHLAAIRERNMQQIDDDGLRSKRTYKRGQSGGNQNTKDEPQNIADLSGTDLFGALPQNYEGQLARFKRVKREAVNNATGSHNGR